MSKQDLIEDLANIEHQRWSDWQAYLHSKAYRGPHTGNLTLDHSLVEHWEGLMHTQYYALPEHSKQADRDQVMRYWPLIVAFVAEWIAGTKDAQFVLNESLAKQWREEMS